MTDPDESDPSGIARVEKAIAQLRKIADGLAASQPLSRERVRDAQQLHENRRPAGEPGRVLQRQPHPDMPDPRLLERILRMRRLRARYFEPELFADPAWDILLELGAARARHQQVCVTSLCIAAAVPTTTALRWIAIMTEKGLLERRADPVDKRRAYISLTDDVARSLARYFDEIGDPSRLPL